MLPARKVSKLVGSRLTLKKAVLNQLARSSDLLSKDTMEEVALGVLKDYRERYADLREEGVPVDEAKDEATNGNKLLMQRVRNSTNYEITRRIQKKYRGTKYEWLPSSAEVPDPLHQLKYGKIFTLGKGEAPGDRYGCECGMRILSDDEELNLDDQEEGD